MEITRTSGVLTDRDIRAYLLETPPLVEGLRDPDTQIQACGVDLTVRSVSHYVSSGTVDFDNAHRALSERRPLEWKDSWVELAEGAYHIVYNERVNLPSNIMALAYPRSSLLRCGATVHTAVWDPGYCGRAEALLMVHNPSGFRLECGARVAQLVFSRISDCVDKSYDGMFRGENS